MSSITISEILDDLRVADEILLKFERRYWITSEQFFELYNQGLLDQGEHAEDYCEWAGFYKLKLKRTAAFKKLGLVRLENLKKLAAEGNISLQPQEPTVEVQ